MAGDPRIVLLPVEDERPHAPGPEPLWQESVVLAFQDQALGLGGYVRIGHQPNEGVGRLTFGLVSPGARYARSKEDVAIRPGDRTGCTFAIDGFASAEFHEHHSLWRAADADCELELRVDNLHPQFDVMAWRAGADGAFHKDFNRHHTEVAGRVTGRMRVGEERYEIAGTGFRDHSWGVRNLENPAVLPTTMFWLIGAFDDDLVFSVAEVTTSAGTRLPMGFIRKDGEWDTPQVEDVSFEVELDGVTTRSARCVFSTPRFGRFEFRAEGLGNVLLALGPRYLETGMPSRIRWGDRVTGGHVSSMFNARVGVGTPRFLLGAAPRNGLYRMSGPRGVWD